VAVLHLIRRLLILLALVLFGLGVWLWLAGYDVTLATGQVWYELHASSLNLIQAVVQRYLHPAIWEVAAVPILLRAFWELVVGGFIVLLVLAGLLSFLADRPERTARFFRKR
jgi:nitrate reductase gamma subunit